MRGEAAGAAVSSPSSSCTKDARVCRRAAFRNRKIWRTAPCSSGAPLSASGPPTAIVTSSSSLLRPRCSSWYRMVRTMEPISSSKGPLSVTCAAKAFRSPGAPKRTWRLVKNSRNSSIWVLYCWPTPCDSICLAIPSFLREEVDCRGLLVAIRFETAMKQGSAGASIASEKAAENGGLCAGQGTRTVP